MPQLDKLAYSTQIFWLLITFTSFYFVLLKNILPAILLNIKTRENLANNIVEENSSSSYEIKKANDTFTKINSDISERLDELTNKMSKELNKFYTYVPAFVSTTSDGTILQRLAVSRRINNRLITK